MAPTLGLVSKAVAVAVKSERTSTTDSAPAAAAAASNANTNNPNTKAPKQHQHMHQTALGGNEIKLQRTKMGQCPDCGIQTHNLEPNTGRLVPIVDEDVRKGRCLLCHPIQRPANTAASVKTVPVKKEDEETDDVVVEAVIPSERKTRSQVPLLPKNEPEDLPSGYRNCPVCGRGGLWQDACKTVQCRNEAHTLVGKPQILRFCIFCKKQCEPGSDYVICDCPLWNSSENREMVHAQLQQPVDLCDSKDEDVKAKDTETEPSGEQTESKRFCDNGYWGTYEGELNKGGLRHGKGKMKWDVGDWYEGQWSNGKREGHGTFRYAGGDVYEGEWKSGLKEGRGKHRWVSGSEYEGEWKNDNLDGHGTLKLADGGLVYEGQRKNGKREGEGTIRWKGGEWDGDKFVGAFKDGKRNGQGTYYFKNGDVEVGVYKDGKLSGERVHWSKDSKTEMKYGTADGERTIRWKGGEWDGDKFVGAFKDGKRNGKRNGRGTYYFKNGDVEVGVYKDGKLSGERVHWSKDRKTAWLLKEGEKTRKITTKKAKGMATQMGFVGVPPVPCE